MNNKINECWAIKVKYGRFSGQVNMNEAYTTYERAKSVVLKKIEPDYRRTINDYTWYDMDNEIEYELKLINVYE